MKDKRLANKSWRRRVGFDNIDRRPACSIAEPRKRYVSPAERISDSIDRELFGKNST